MPIDATQLRRQLLQLFSEEELRTLAADLGIDLADLPAEGREAQARELVGWAQRQGRVADLVAEMRRARPDAQVAVRRLVRRHDTDGYGRTRTTTVSDMADGFTIQQAQLDRLSATMEEIRRMTTQLVTQMALTEQRLSAVERRLDAIEGRQAPTKLTWLMMAVGLVMTAVLIWVVLRVGLP